MRMLLIVVVLIYGMELDPASWWYFAAAVAAAGDTFIFYVNSPANS